MSSVVRGGFRSVIGLALVAGLCVHPAEVVRPGTQADDIALLSGSGPVLNLIMSGSGYPIPPQGFVDAVYNLYFEPMGLVGTPMGVVTPELYTYPMQSMQLGADLLIQQITRALAEDPDTTFNVFGYSQSASLITLAMQDLHEQGIAPDQVHFVMAGNPSAPNGGLLNMLDLAPFRQILESVGQDEVGLKTPDGLYSADVYNLEYDGFVSFPKYALNLVSTLNALLGLAFGHLAYVGLTPEQIDSAITLPIEGDSLVEYHMIPSALVPILAPLLFIPKLGLPLYHLLEPVTRIVANLGYGNLDHGWSDDPVNVAQTVDLSRIIPADIDTNELFAALAAGWAAGVQAFTEDLGNLQAIESGLANELLQPLVRFAQNLGALEPDNDAPSLLEFLGSNIVAQRENEVHFLENYSTTQIPALISYLFGTPYGFLLLSDADFPEFTFDLN